MFLASMKFDLGEDVNALREMVHRFAQGRIKPLAADVDRDNVFPSELWREMGELGLLNICSINPSAPSPSSQLDRQS